MFIYINMLANELNFSENITLQEKRLFLADEKRYLTIR